MFGTCYRCLSVCVRVFLVNRTDTVGMCADCIGTVSAIPGYFSTDRSVW